MNKDNIPKVIHYAWFGRGAKPESAIKCIETWYKYLPDYQFIEWNEDNFDINQNLYVKQAYEAKKYAYVTDFVRLFALYHYGGVYMDTDVEVLKSLDPLLENHGFSGFESETQIPTGIMAAKKGNTWVYEQLKFYDEARFINENGSYNYTTNVDYITNVSLEKHNFIPNNQMQTLKYDFTIYPKEYFCPKSLETGKIDCTENTYTIHHFNGSWVPKSKKIKRKMYRLIKFIFGEKISKLFLKRGKN